MMKCVISRSPCWTFPVHRIRQRTAKAEVSGRLGEVPLSTTQGHGIRVFLKEVSFYEVVESV